MTGAQLLLIWPCPAGLAVEMVWQHARENAPLKCISPARRDPNVCMLLLKFAAHQRRSPTPLRRWQATKNLEKAQKGWTGEPEELAQVRLRAGGWARWLPNCCLWLS